MLRVQLRLFHCSDGLNERSSSINVQNMHSQFLIYFNHPSAAAGRLNGSGTVWQVWVASNAIRRRPYHLPSIFIEIQLSHISFVLLLLLLLLLKYGSVHVNFQITLPAFRMGLHLPSSPTHWNPWRTGNRERSAGEIGPVCVRLNYPLY